MFGKFGKPYQRSVFELNPTIPSPRPYYIHNGTWTIKSPISIFKNMILIYKCILCHNAPIKWSSDVEENPKLHFQKQMPLPCDKCIFFIVICKYFFSWGTKMSWPGTNEVSPKSYGKLYVHVCSVCPRRNEMN